MARANNSETDNTLILSDCWLNGIVSASTSSSKSVRAICTHAVLSGKAFENINNSYLEELVVADTIPLSQQSEKIKVLSVSELFARAIRRIHDYKSISSLFVNQKSE